MEKDFINVINQDGIILCNSDTIPALICRFDSDIAINKIFKIKERSKTKPFAIFVNEIDMAMQFCHFSHNDISFFNAIFPGFFTLICKLKEDIRINEFLISEENKIKKIGIRVPKNDFLLSIINKIKIPLVATSANLSEQKTPKTIEEVDLNIKNQVDLFINNKTILSQTSSTIIDISQEKKKILRNGSGDLKSIKYFLYDNKN